MAQRREAEDTTAELSAEGEGLNNSFSNLEEESDEESQQIVIDVMGEESDEVFIKQEESVTLDDVIDNGTMQLTLNPKVEETSNSFIGSA